MSMVTLQTETPTGAAAAPPAAHAPTPPAITADGEPSGSKGIQVTARALKRIRVAMAKENISPAAGGLRVGITGGGCSGLSYNIRFDSHPRERDRIFSFSQTHLDPTLTDAPSIRIFVDPKSFIYLSGMVLDYEETLMRQAFNFINPHSTKSCGCGSSFST
ncbi:MAG TPA: iron-sulfur cluster assembly accessory protein [Acidobacteriaceae bacterium]|jgi:iron-sulfur cluster assembly protein|nr:iron-sulfur cluster assembly accessory protein [Acidobacteriaceae bacterium]